MNRINCEDILIAKMAELDGEKTEIAAEQLSLHLADCDRCRQEFGQMQLTDNLLKRQKRREQKADLWPSVRERIDAPAE